MHGGEHPVFAQDVAVQLQSLLQRTLRALEVPDGVSASYMVALYNAMPLSFNAASSGGRGGGRLQGLLRQMQLAWMVLQEGIEFFWLVRNMKQLPFVVGGGG